jgi:uncharacterized integral membrane protein
MSGWLRERLHHLPGDPPGGRAPTAPLTRRTRAADSKVVHDPESAQVPPELVARAETLSRRHSFRVGLGVGITAGVLLTIAVVLLIIQNAQATPLHWAGFSFTAPLWIFLLLTLAAGLVLGPVALRLIRRGRTKQRRAALRRARKPSGHDRT